jgi:hypothetical protein
LKEKRDGSHPQCGGDFDSWDLELKGGLFGGARLQIVIEEHGAGKQLIRFRTWPKIKSAAGVLLLLSLAFFVAAAYDGAAIPEIIFGAAAFFLFWRMAQECSEGLSAFLDIIDQTQGKRGG